MPPRHEPKVYKLTGGGTAIVWENDPVRGIGSGVLRLICLVRGHRNRSKISSVKFLGAAKINQSRHVLIGTHYENGCERCGLTKSTGVISEIVCRIWLR